MKPAPFGAAVALALGCLAPASGAFALPGQSLAQFRAWVAPRVLLRGLTTVRNEMSGRPAFDLLTSDHGIVWSFHATSDGRTIRSERLGVGGGTAEPGSTPIRRDGSGYGFVFFRSLYGPGVATDFLASSQLASLTDRRSRVVTAFYRGKRFGYELSAGTLTLTTRPGVVADLALFRRCNAAPDSCDE